MQALLGYVSEARWLRHARRELRHLFACLPGQSGHNKRLRSLAGLGRGLPGVARLRQVSPSDWLAGPWWLPTVRRTAVFMSACLSNTSFTAAGVSLPLSMRLIICWW
jgi:hypothetical protein